MRYIHVATVLYNKALFATPHIIFIARCCHVMKLRNCENWTISTAYVQLINAICVQFSDSQCDDYERYNLLSHDVVQS
jgi:hypothetical protein